MIHFKMVPALSLCFLLNVKLQEEDSPLHLPKFVVVAAWWVLLLRFNVQLNKIVNWVKQC